MEREPATDTSSRGPRRRGHGLGPFAAAIVLVPALAPAAELQVDAKSRTVRIPAVAAEQGKYEVLKGAIEYVLVSRGGKEYETLFVTDCAPEDIRARLAEIGFEAGAPVGDSGAPRGARLGIHVEYEQAGKTVLRPVDELIRRSRTDESLRPRAWTFTGSTRAFDPEAGKDVLQCSVTKSIVGLHYGDPSSLLQNSRSEARDDNIYRTDTKALPPPGTAVTLVLAPFRREIPAGTRRVHVFIGGRVQGVGFRAYAEGQARRLELEGFIKNLPDGRLEAVIEGPQDRVAQVLQKLEKGPRAARVKSLETKDETPGGEFGEFRVEE